MSIRIDHVCIGHETVLHVAGRLCGPAVVQLRKACDPLEGPFVIDLSSLSFADEDGINILRALIDRGATVHGASPFIEMLLESVVNGKREKGRNRNQLSWT